MIRSLIRKLVVQAATTIVEAASQPQAPIASIPSASQALPSPRPSPTPIPSSSSTPAFEAPYSDEPSFVMGTVSVDVETADRVGLLAVSEDVEINDDAETDANNDDANANIDEDDAPWSSSPTITDPYNHELLTLMGIEPIARPAFRVAVRSANGDDIIETDEDAYRSIDMGVIVMPSNASSNPISHDAILLALAKRRGFSTIGKLVESIGEGATFDVAPSKKREGAFVVTAKVPVLLDDAGFSEILKRSFGAIYGHIKSLDYIDVSTQLPIFSDAPGGQGPVGVRYMPATVKRAARLVWTDSRVTDLDRRLAEHGWLRYIANGSDHREHPKNGTYYEGYVPVLPTASQPPTVVKIVKAAGVKLLTSPSAARQAGVLFGGAPAPWLLLAVHPSLASRLPHG